MSVDTSLLPRQSILSKLALPRDDRTLLLTLAIPLALWCVLALIVRQILPYANSSASQNFTVFVDYVFRNGSVFLIFLFAYVLIKLPKTRGQTSLLTDLKEAYAVHSEKIIAFPPMLLAAALSFIVFMFSYMSLKVRITEIIPFSWDVPFAQWDKILFFGNDPWTVFAWVYDMPALVLGINFVYEAWAGLLVGSWIACFILQNISVTRRIQFLLALIIAWFVGGNVLATLLSSAGPCFYANVNGGDPYFADQIQRLASIEGLAVLETQTALWNSHTIGSNLGGVSAMPSMHCTTSFLLFLMFGRTRLTRAVTFTFFMFIWCSSVILAWHYALDGLLAIPVALSSWMVAGWISRRVTSKSNAA